MVAEDLSARAGEQPAAASRPGARTGGHLVAESLEVLGAEVVFGVPGIHSLAVWEGVRTSRLRAYGARTELCAGFAADGYARASGRPAPLLLSTGPGALNALTALMESASSHVPVVAISSQIPRELIGRDRGYLHELPNQLASFAPVVKHAACAESTEVIPELVSEAWAIALTPPSGPVYLEIPVDVLTAPARRPVGSLAGPPAPSGAEPGMVAAAARLLAVAERPAIWAGGGVLRARAQAELAALAELLDAPVVTTYMGKGALADTDPLAVGSGCDETAVQELLTGADVLLCVGTELGAETTGQYSLRFGGQLIHVDAVPARIGATYPALPLVGDAKLTLAALRNQLPRRSRPEVRGRVAELRDRVRRGLLAQERQTELELLGIIEDALPDDAISTWDMTILGYWAAAHLRLRGEQQFLYPLGSGTLGYAWPAAIGASIAHPDRTALAVVGDGGLAYALAELAAARQHAVGAKLVVIDDGGFGILREYQRDAYGETGAVDLMQPDFTAIGAAFGIPARLSAPGELGEHLAWALSGEGPAMVVVPVTLTAPQPTP